MRGALFLPPSPPHLNMWRPFFFFSVFLRATSADHRHSWIPRCGLFPATGSFLVSGANPSYSIQAKGSYDVTKVPLIWVWFFKLGPPRMVVFLLVSNKNENNKQQKVPEKTKTEPYDLCCWLNDLPRLVGIIWGMKFRQPLFRFPNGSFEGVVLFF